MASILGARGVVADQKTRKGRNKGLGRTADIEPERRRFQDPWLILDLYPKKAERRLGQP
jgi:hypothetical protein